MIHVPCEQGSPEWYEARKGIPTASEFKSILTQKTLKFSATSEKYAAQLIGEILSPILPENVENYTNRAMNWGRETEEEARRYFTLRTGFEVRTCGFCKTDDGRFGCSPDGLVVDDKGEIVGGCEIKCPQPANHVEYLLGNVLPDEHRAQVHGGLIVTGLPRWWFLSYHPGMDPLLVSVVPDSYTSALRAALETFWSEYQTKLARVRGQ